MTTFCPPCTPPGLASPQSHRRRNNCPCTQAVPQPQLWKAPLCPCWLTSTAQLQPCLPGYLDVISSPTPDSSSTTRLSNPDIPPVTDRDSAPWEACTRYDSGPSLLMPGWGHLVWLAYELWDCGQVFNVICFLSFFLLLNRDDNSPPYLVIR